MCVCVQLKYIHRGERDLSAGLATSSTIMTLTSPFINPRISPLTIKNECPQLSLLIITSALKHIYTTSIARITRCEY